MTDQVVPPLPPTAKRVDTRREHHGDVFVDPYEWLRDKESPEVIAYLEAENEYVEQLTAHLEPLRQKIFDEIKARTKETDLSVPTRRGDWWYYARSFEGKQYGVHCRSPITDPDDWKPPQFGEDGFHLPRLRILARLRRVHGEPDERGERRQRERGGAPLELFGLGE